MNSEEVFERMQALSQRDTVGEIWEEWCEIANAIIPEGFNAIDASEGSIPPNIEDIDDIWIFDRLDYLSDRADSARIYWLDWAIRYFLQLPCRD
jgi:hypothetical protein